VFALLREDRTEIYVAARQIRCVGVLVLVLERLEDLAERHLQFALLLVDAGQVVERDA